jgi:hypothetical protein
VRATLVALALLAGCRCKQSTKATNEPPPERPRDVLCEAVVPDPAATWERTRDILGLAAVALPRTAFGAFSRALYLPKDLEKKLEPGAPLVAVAVAKGGAVAWKLRDPDRFEPVDARYPIALSKPFLVAATSSSLIASHSAYLVRGLATTTHASDAHIDVMDARAPEVTRVAEQLEKLLPTLDIEASDAPSDRTRVSKELAALARAYHGWSGPIRVEISLRDDSAIVVAGPSGTEAKARLSGEVIRWWVRSRAHL